MRKVPTSVWALRSAAAVYAVAALLGTAEAQQLYGCDRSGRLFLVNLATGAGAHVCNLPTFPDPGATEIEFDDVSSMAWVQGRDGVFSGRQFDILSCASLGPLLPTSSLALNGLEYVGGVLYGTGIPFSCQPSVLVTLDTATGNAATVGPTGVGPIAGLAWRDGTQTMYGITGCSQAGFSDLVTIDLTTGTAAVVGNTGIYAGSLEFGPTGLLYAGGSTVDGGRVYTVNPLSAAATLLGPSGFDSVTGLTQAVGPPLTVLITDFRAEPADEGVRLQWSIFADEDILGFRVYRGATNGGERDLTAETGPLASHARAYTDRSAEGGSTYRYVLAVVRADGSELRSPAVSAQARPGAFALYQNTPNPFNPATRIVFRVSRSGRVVLAVYDVEGRHVTTLVDRAVGEGRHEIAWDGTDASGVRVGSGVYFYRLTSGKETLTKKMLLLK